MNNRQQIFFRQNTRFGLLIGLTLILTSFIYFQMGNNINVNPQLSNIFTLLSIAGMFIGCRKYREENLNGLISFGASLGTCIYLIAIASLFYAVYIYFLYTFYPNLVTNYITIIKATFKELYANSPMFESMTTMIKTFTSPASIALTEFFTRIFSGIIFSFILAAILQRKAYTNSLNS